MFKDEVTESILKEIDEAITLIKVDMAGDDIASKDKADYYRELMHLLAEKEKITRSGTSYIKEQLLYLTLEKYI
ncbi:hypothetical protein N9043_00175 [bacterium]|nr:hypothetical protein [bacterium]